MAILWGCAALGKDLYADPCFLDFNIARNTSENGSKGLGPLLPGLKGAGWWDPRFTAGMR